MIKEALKKSGANVLIIGHRCFRCNYEWKPNNMNKLPKVCPNCKSPYWDKPKTNGTKK